MKEKRAWCENILIYGLGAIGGSIGLKIKKLGLAKNIYGISRTKHSVDLALKKGCIDKGTTDFKELVGLADFVIFAVPPLKVLEILRKIHPYLKQKVYLTDVSSVKAKIYYEIDKFVNDLNIRKGMKLKYIGSHPMAGTEKKGVEHSFIEMLDNSMVLITPFENANTNDVKRIQEFWTAFGTRTKIISIKEHDEWTAYTSHFPHVLSALLCNLVHNQFKKNSNIKNAIASSFKSMTRISDSESDLWAEIILMNGDNIEKIIKNFKKIIENFENILETRDIEKIQEFFEHAKKNKEEIMR